MYVILTYLALLFVPLIIFIIVSSKKKNKFLADRGIKHLKPTIVFGNVLPMILKKKSQLEIWDEICKTFPEEPIVGYYNFVSPTLLIQSADYVEKILIKDFTHFTNHGFEKLIEKTKSPFDESLFTMGGNRWRAFRYKLSPLFTTGKLKGMFPSMGVCSNGLVEYLKKQDKDNFELQTAAGMFALDVIGSSIFGIEANVMKNPDCEYHKLGKKAFDTELMDYIRALVMILMPGFVVRKLGVQFNKPDVINYFSRIINEAFKYRRENSIQRNDLIQLLLQLKEKQKIEIQSWDPNDDYLKTDELGEVADSYEITDEILTVQAFSFLIAGYDSLSLSIMYTCFELTQNIEIQDTVRNEILEQVKIHSGLNYEALKSMTYLENTVKEALRLHPVVPLLQRSCTKDYTFPNGYTMHKGETLQIPITAIHRNPNYHEDPNVFKPERFEGPIKPGTFLTFGDGPRICIAMRYAFLHTKLAIATILMNYKLTLNPKTKVPFALRPVSFFKTPKEKITFDLHPITT